MPGSRRWRGAEEFGRRRSGAGGARAGRSEGRVAGREAEEFNLQETGVLQVREEEG